MKEYDDLSASEQSFPVEVAGTVITLTNAAAAVVIYADNSMNGKKISVSTPEEGDKSAQFILRSVGGTSVCAAIFPRLKLPSSRGQSKAEIKDTEVFKVPTEYKNVELFAGNVTEVDLRSIPKEYYYGADYTGVYERKFFNTTIRLTREEAALIVYMPCDCKGDYLSFWSENVKQYGNKPQAEIRKYYEIDTSPAKTVCAAIFKPLNFVDEKATSVECRIRVHWRSLDQRDTILTVPLHRGKITEIDCR